MMREPWFWKNDSIAARALVSLLFPVSLLYDFCQKLRWRTCTPYVPTVPVICIGNASLGGVGKTPFAIALARLLQGDYVDIHFLSRGYGGKESGPIRVDPNTHHHEQVGDEALLLADCGPTWVAKNRADGVKAASQAGADLIIMDDGFQNPTVKKTFSILLNRADVNIKNSHIFPAGPWREPLSRAAERSDVIVTVINEDVKSKSTAVDGAFAYLRPAGQLDPQRVVAFSGIGDPDKFFATLKSNCYNVAKSVAFADHHVFAEQELNALIALSKEHSAQLITTEKDFKRVSAAFQEFVTAFPIAMEISEGDKLKSMIQKEVAKTFPRKNQEHYKS